MGGLPRLKLFLRFDRFDRFVSALLLAPRDHINAKIRSDIHALLAKAFNGRTIRLRGGGGRKPAGAAALTSSAAMKGRCRKSMCVTLERQIAAMIIPGTKRWPMQCAPAWAAAKVPPWCDWRRCSPRFSPGYRDNFPAHEGARDLDMLQEWSPPGRAECCAPAPGASAKAMPHRRCALKLYVLGEVLPLSASLPVFENLGLKVIAEDSYPCPSTPMAAGGRKR